mgnify:CR=1 FL=1
MTSEELAAYQEKFTAQARARVMGTGREQYDRGSRQQFEDYTFTRLIDETKEELLDIVNYATMMAIRLDSIREQFTVKGLNK